VQDESALPIVAPLHEPNSLQDDTALPISAKLHESSSSQDESTLPIVAKLHENSPVQDGPTTYGIVAPAQAFKLPLQELSLQTNQVI